jgi:hypothetical protein
MTYHEIHQEIDRLSERRSELWRTLSDRYETGLADELKRIDEELESLWAAHRQLKATARYGERERIVARARAEERLERAAA